MGLRTSCLIGQSITTAMLQSMLPLVKPSPIGQGILSSANQIHSYIIHHLWAPKFSWKTPTAPTLFNNYILIIVCICLALYILAALITLHLIILRMLYVLITLHLNVTRMILCQ